MSHTGSSRVLEHQVLIVGGGTAGISVAAQLTRRLTSRLDVAVVEPSRTHYCQCLWTLVGAGVVPKDVTARPMKEAMPRRATWIHDAVSEFLPERNLITTRDGRTISYDWLVVAAGMQVKRTQVTGLEESLGENGVCSNYSYATVDSTWKAIRSFNGGTAIFTHPSGIVKGDGAPQKIMYLADDHFREAGVRNRTTIIFASAQPQLFAIEPYRKALEQLTNQKQIECRFRHDLIEVRPQSKQAIFRQLDTGQVVTMGYDMLHVTPPMGPPDFVAKSRLANQDGWVAVDQTTLRHERYENVFALGDCGSLPTSKTGAAIRRQAPVLVRNLRSAIGGRALATRYDGYTLQPSVPGFGKRVMAEFDYELHPRDAFSIYDSRLRSSRKLMKRYVLPLFYWHGMLKGRT